LLAFPAFSGQIEIGLSSHGRRTSASIPAFLPKLVTHVAGNALDHVTRFHVASVMHRGLMDAAPRG